MDQKTGLPQQVTLRELGPREGLQTEKQVISLENKLALIESLAAAGASEIEVTSFVRPEKVPQMADAEELVEAVAELKLQYPKTKFTALYLNYEGFERAVKFPHLLRQGWIYTAASLEFLKRNNNRTSEQIVAELPGWFERFAKHGVPFHGVMLSAAFGSNYEGAISVSVAFAELQKIIEAATQIDSKYVPAEISLADTMGWANPNSVQQFVELVRKAYPSATISLHLHDTRGLGIANVYAGLLCGVDLFDCSVGGVGGCPFAKGAAGNVVSEDIAYLCQSLGIETGVNLERYAAAAKLASAILGRELPGKYHRM